VVNAHNDDSDNRYAPKERTPVVIRWICRFHEPTRFAAFQAVFAGEKPATIWSYRGLSYFERPANPARGERLVPGADGGVEAAFHDLYGGLYSGIAWRW